MATNGSKPSSSQGSGPGAAASWTSSPATPVCRSGWTSSATISKAFGPSKSSPSAQSAKWSCSRSPLCASFRGTTLRSPGRSLGFRKSFRAVRLPCGKPIWRTAASSMPSGLKSGSRGILPSFAPIRRSIRGNIICPIFIPARRSAPWTTCPPMRFSFLMSPVSPKPVGSSAKRKSRRFSKPAPLAARC